MVARWNSSIPCREVYTCEKQKLDIIIERLSKQMEVPCTLMQEIMVKYITTEICLIIEIPISSHGLEQQL